jgi:hypothetical protein
MVYDGGERRNRDIRQPSGAPLAALLGRGRCGPSEFRHTDLFAFNCRLWNRAGRRWIMMLTNTSATASLPTEPVLARD